MLISTYFIFAVSRKPFWDSLLRSRAFLKLEILVCKLFGLLQGSEAQCTTDLLLLRFSSHWPHPLSFLIDLPLRLMQLCLFFRLGCFHMLKTLGFASSFRSRFSASASCPFVPARFTSLLISFITFPGSRRTFEAFTCKYCIKRFLRAFLSPLRNVSARRTASIFY